MVLAGYEWEGALMASLTTETIVQPEIEPAIKHKLLAQLNEYSALIEQIKELEEMKQDAAIEISRLRELTGQQSLSLNGYKVTNIQSTTKTLDKKLYVSLGGSLALLEQSYVEKPRRAYERITLPNDSTDSE